MNETCKPRALIRKFLGVWIIVVYCDHQMAYRFVDDYGEALQVINSVEVRKL